MFAGVRTGAGLFRGPALFLCYTTDVLPNDILYNPRVHRIVPGSLFVRTIAAEARRCGLVTDLFLYGSLRSLMWVLAWWVIPPGKGDRAWLRTIESMRSHPDLHPEMAPRIDSILLRLRPMDEHVKDAKRKWADEADFKRRYEEACKDGQDFTVRVLKRRGQWARAAAIANTPGHYHVGPENERFVEAFTTQDNITNRTRIISVPPLELSAAAGSLRAPTSP